MTPLAAKLLLLCLDAAATPGESEAAAVKLVRHWRADGVSADELLGGSPKSTPAALAMPFGQYRGVSLASIAADDPKYLEWVLANVSRLRPGLRKAIQAALESRD